MTTVDAVDSAHDHGGNHGQHEHGHHEHGEFIAHHFTGPRQQYDSAKLGIWLFLVTEVLFFSGLFVAYTIYRYHHPEVFNLASEFLDTTLGALNTIVLLFSSLTMAWAAEAFGHSGHDHDFLCSNVSRGQGGRVQPQVAHWTLRCLFL